MDEQQNQPFDKAQGVPPDGGQGGQQSTQVPSQSAVQTVPPQLSSDLIPWWKKDVGIVVALLLFWPVGLYLMWKFAPWRKWVKIAVSIFFGLSLLPFLFVWTFIFTLQGGFFIQEKIDPATPNQSFMYRCEPMDAEWSKCTNTKYKFSFEYPATWHYVDLKPEGIGFSPSKENIKSDFVVGMAPYAKESEEEAMQSAKDGVKKEQTYIDGLFATKDLNAFEDEFFLIGQIQIVDKNMLYQFNTIPDKERIGKYGLTQEQVREIFEHMGESFEKEK